VRERESVFFGPKWRHIYSLKEKPNQGKKVRKMSREKREPSQLWRYRAWAHSMVGLILNLDAFEDNDDFFTAIVSRQH